ncbi:sigma-54 dependent transcriptional regulator [Desulfovibrio subterraneus]|uniref:sigma-54-dependent transcriptional regulator n=1 Tax=Desulfovibrio subterraneus TaxID=2718620 RepID=UPI0022B8687D|nr:sigma-54 dependent transcriptional regulator [Desulfovibrio subterraneus]WBF66974.1 sigma-54 dependent transcriptional regulator [Desulfovibrio subterraneus]
MRILIVDDNTTSLQSLRIVLSDLGHEPAPFTDPQLALEEARRNRYPLIITDIRMPRMDGLTLLKELKGSPDTETCDVVLITGHGDMETAVGALRHGAYDYLNKPINARELAAVVERSAEHQALLSENRDLRQHLDSRVNEVAGTLRRDLDEARTLLREVSGIGTVVSQSPATERVMNDARMFHNDPSVPVLIEGETGTGKEIIARLIHFGESGCEHPFVAINCAAIPHELFESELFGHEAGAYTGSRAGGSPGKLELAAGGTLFLDEVAEMPLTLQPKLLRVLEERTFYRVGGIRKREFRARVICAANIDLAGQVERGHFRRDLYHRLKVGHLVIPPLRERQEDIPALAGLFLKRQAERKRKQFTSISSEAMDVLLRHMWRGNVRELENTIERAVLVNDDPILKPEHIAFLNMDRSLHCGAESMGTIPLDIENLELPEAPIDLEALTTAIVQKALDRFDGNKSKAAAYLGISRFALHRRLQK